MSWKMMGRSAAWFSRMALGQDRRYCTHKKRKKTYEGESRRKRVGGDYPSQQRKVLLDELRLRGHVNLQGHKGGNGERGQQAAEGHAVARVRVTAKNPHKDRGRGQQ